MRVATRFPAFDPAVYSLKRQVSWYAYQLNMTNQMIPNTGSSTGIE